MTLARPTLAALAFLVLTPGCDLFDPNGDGGGPKPSDPTTDLARVALDAHDQVRGNATPTPSPALPGTQWSAEVEAVAARWAAHCVYEHNAGRGNLGGTSPRALPGTGPASPGWCRHGPRRRRTTTTPPTAAPRERSAATTPSSSGGTARSSGAPTRAAPAIRPSRACPPGTSGSATTALPVTGPASARTDCGRGLPYHAGPPHAGGPGALALSAAPPVGPRRLLRWRLLGAATPGRRLHRRGEGAAPAGGARPGARPRPGRATVRGPRHPAPPGDDGLARGAGVLRSGAAPHLRLQPRRGGALVRAGRRARSRLRDRASGASRWRSAPTTTCRCCPTARAVGVGRAAAGARARRARRRPSSRR